MSIFKKVRIGKLKGIVLETHIDTMEQDSSYQNAMLTLGLTVSVHDSFSINDKVLSSVFGFLTEHRSIFHKMDYWAYIVSSVNEHSVTLTPRVRNLMYSNDVVLSIEHYLMYCRVNYTQVVYKGKPFDVFGKVENFATNKNLVPRLKAVS